ncbi:MAG: hypothetical protein ACETWC_01410 [Acidobacteriota bacterium]
MKKSVFILNVSVIFLLILAFSSGFIYAQAEQKERRLHIAIVGGISNPDPLYNPYTYCNLREVQLLLLDMAEQPMSGEEITARLSGSKASIDDLLRLEIIRQEGDRYYINFPLFTENDQQLITRVADIYSQKLADSISQKKEEIYRLLEGYRPTGVEPSKLGFIMIGGLILDLGGLRLLSEHGYIAHGVEKPGGNRYILNAQEVTEFSLKEIYWGCHIDSVNGITLMTFGDHHFETVRNGFPDLLWGLGRRLGTSLRKELPELYGTELLTVLNDQMNSFLEDVVTVLLRLKESPAGLPELEKATSLDRTHLENTLNFLVKIRYISQEDDAYHLLIPVLTKADKEMFQKIRGMVSEEILNWLQTYYDRIKEDLKDISAVRNRVNYGEVFNILWHYFFGYTNKFLARSGLIYDTYSAPQGFTGFLPAVLSGLER